MILASQVLEVTELSDRLCAFATKAQPLSQRSMAKSNSLKEQLKKAAKRRANRPTPQQPADAPTSSLVSAAIDAIANGILKADRDREDLNDRLLLLALKSMLRGAVASDSLALIIQQELDLAINEAQVAARYRKLALEELISVVDSYGTERASPRAALMYLHSMAS